MSSSVESMSFDVDCWILSYKNVLFSAIISVAIFKQYSSFKTIFQYFATSSTTNFLPNVSRFLFIFTIPSKSTFFELFLIAKHIQNTVRYEYTVFFYYRYIAITSLGDGEARNMGLDLPTVTGVTNRVRGHLLSRPSLKNPPLSVATNILIFFFLFEIANCKMGKKSSPAT